MKMKCLLVLLAICGCLKGSNCITNYYLDKHCGQTVNIAADEAVSLQFSSAIQSRPAMDCQMTFSTSHRMTVDFQKFLFDTSFCYRNWNMKFHDGPSLTSPSLAESKTRGTLCGYSNSYLYEVLATLSSHLTVHYVVNENYIPTSRSLEIIITPFHKGGCVPGEVRCNNGRCINGNVACTVNNPCGDYSDCNTPISDRSSVALIVGVVVGSISCVVAIVTFIVCIIRSRRYHAGLRASPGVVMYHNNPGTVNINTTAFPNQGQPQGQYPGQNDGQYSTQFTYSNPTAYGFHGSQTQANNPNKY